MYFTNFAMPLDVVRHENDVTLRLDVPGMDREQIEVTVDRGILTISGKRQEERTENDKFFVRERRMGTVNPSAAAAGEPERGRGAGQLGTQWRPQLEDEHAPLSRSGRRRSRARSRLRQADGQQEARRLSAGRPEAQRSTREARSASGAGCVPSADTIWA